MRWVEAVPLRLCNTIQVLSFLENQIITRFGTLEYLVFDNASYFQSIELTNYTLEKGIKLKFFANYYPQGNGLAESSNKNLISILKKIVASHQKNWHVQLYYALWADQISPKAALGNSPYCLIYGKEAVLPSNLTIPSLLLAQSIQESDSSPLHQRIDSLFKLAEDREKAKNKFYQHQQLVKKWFDERFLSRRSSVEVG